MWICAIATDLPSDKRTKNRGRGMNKIKIEDISAMKNNRRLSSAIRYLSTGAEIMR